jgi:hypothetical protein
MKKPKVIAQHVQGPATYHLPASLNREIGRIIIRWAYFEHCVQDLNYKALEIGPEAGRIALREPRISERLEMLRDLVQLRSATWDTKLFDSIMERAKLLSTKRHLLAHGLWHRYRAPIADEYHVQLARGSWPKSLADLVTGSKKIIPEGVLMNLDKLKTTTDEIEKLTEDLATLRTSANLPSPPSPEKSPE